LSTQKIIVAAMQIALKNVWAHRSRDDGTMPVFELRELVVFDPMALRVQGFAIAGWRAALIWPSVSRRMIGPPIPSQTA